MKKAIPVILLLTVVFLGLASCGDGAYIGVDPNENGGLGGGGFGGSVASYKVADLKKLRPISGDKLPSDQGSASGLFGGALGKGMDMSEDVDLYSKVMSRVNSLQTAAENVAERAAGRQTIDIKKEFGDELAGSGLTIIQGKISGSETNFSCNIKAEFDSRNAKGWNETQDGWLQMKVSVVAKGTQTSFNYNGSCAVAYDDGDENAYYLVTLKASASLQGKGANMSIDAQLQVYDDGYKRIYNFKDDFSL